MFTEDGEKTKMCRILLHNAPSLTFEETGELLNKLVAENGGDGSGFVYSGEDGIGGVKSSNWGQEYTPFLTSLLMRMREDTGKPVLFHTRKTSSGSTTTHFTHPHMDTPFVHGQRWESFKSNLGDDCAMIEGVQGGLFVHNGTVKGDDVKLMKLATKMGNTNIPAKLFHNTNDTQMIGFLLQATKRDLDILHLFDFGVIVGAYVTDKGETKYYFCRQSSRTLFVTMFSQDEWILSSSVSDKFWELSKAREARIYEVPPMTVTDVAAYTRRLWADSTPATEADLKKNSFCPYVKFSSK